jgi:hypothetical protein
MKMCSASLTIGEMQMKAMVRKHLTPLECVLSKRQEIVSIGEDVQKRESL